MSIPVDIVIATQARGERIDTAIASIRQSTHQLFTLWVIDGSSDSQTEECVLRHAASDSRIRYCRSLLPGVTGKRNAGAALGQAPYILFTNDDCRVAPGWVAAMVEQLSLEETWAVFGRVLADPTYEPDSAAGREMLALQEATERELFEGDRFNIHWGQGHNMGVRRSCYEALQGFDELLGAGTILCAGDERDYMYRVLANNGRLVYAPDALIYHRHWSDSEQTRLATQNYAIGAGAIAAKYLRCGDLPALILIAWWLWHRGLRWTLSGMFKYRSRERIAMGLEQLVYPWIGFARSFCYRVDREHMLFRLQTPLFSRFQGAIHGKQE